MRKKHTVLFLLSATLPVIFCCRVPLLKFHAATLHAMSAHQPTKPSLRSFLSTGVIPGHIEAATVQRAIHPVRHRCWASHHHTAGQETIRDKR